MPLYAYILWGMLGLWAVQTLGAALHPLDPLDEAEIHLAAERVRALRDFPKGALFSMIALNEPPKAEVGAFKPGDLFRREAIAIILDRTANQTYEAVVDLRGKGVISWKKVANVQPMVLPEEYEAVAQIVKADPRWQKAMRRRGISNFDTVAIDTWATGNIAPSGTGRARLLRGLSYWKDGASNFYGRPIEGVVALVDMNQGRVVELVDTGVVPIAPFTQELDERAIGRQRRDLTRLQLVQPKGPSFRIEGYEVRWQKWRFRFGLHPREGLVLYTIGYEDQGRWRPILYRASLSEMVVPYGDPDPTWAWRNAFDEGEYGLGRLTTPLERGLDVPPNAVFFDAELADGLGRPYTLSNAIALYERDGGILWKHFDFYTGRNETRRARELVLQHGVTIGNYDYVFSWIFGQDGALGVEVALSGILLPKGVSETPGPYRNPYGGLVAHRIAAPHHQHFFNYRLDFDVDGVYNSVVEVNTYEQAPGLQNPLMNGIVVDEQVLEKESQAQRDVNMKTSRRWRIINPNGKPVLGYPPGYLLVPGENTFAYPVPGSQLRQRAAFIDHHFWVTRYRPAELYAAGDYPNQSQGGEGLARWMADNEALVNEDIVVWYTFGITHLSRPEEWPVMPADHAGFKLIPAGFFTANPALDVPKPRR